ncbi:MAG: NUDIX domain-containing protein [Thermoplasmata archaeon]|nr:NUDIX domain-containing protein [Thermoplasmata archaeon]
MRVPATPLAPGLGRGRLRWFGEGVDWPALMSSGQGGEREILAGLEWNDSLSNDAPPEARVPAGVILVGADLLPRSSGFPIVGGIDRDLLVDGEWVTVDGSLGVVDLEEVEGVPVVTSFLEREDGRVLLLRRSEQVGSFRGRWAGVSGFVESRPPEDQARREIEEETGLRATELELRARAEPVYVREGARGYIVHPFLFTVRRTELRLDWEHTEARWVDPEEIRKFSTVPKLVEVWNRLATDAAERKR